MTECVSGRQTRLDGSLQAAPEVVVPHTPERRGEEIKVVCDVGVVGHGHGMWVW